MEIIGAGLLAAASAWVGNRLALRVWGPAAIIYLVPLLEEGAKTLWAYALGIPIFFTHLIFGGIEAIYDLGTARRNGVYAGLISFFSHLFFGVVTMEGFARLQSLPLAILLGVIVHMAWNLFVMKFLVRSQERSKPK